MGINAQDLDLLIKLKEEGHLANQSSVIEIGAQQCANDFLKAEAKLKRMGELFGVTTRCPLPHPLTSTYEYGLDLLSTQAPPSHIFWKWLNFKYSSVDLDESFNSVFLDLNYDDVPRKQRGKYQLVTNFGTTEHVANQLNAFKIIHDLTAVGGIMMHDLPSQGMQNHGLINYNAKFFWMLARSNAYEWVHIDYKSSEIYQPLHKDVQDQVMKYVKDIEERGTNYTTADSSLIIILKKTQNTSYVAPLDVCTGTKTNNKALKKRYWSIFE